MEKFMTVVIVFAFTIGLVFLLAYPTMWLVNYLFTPALLLAIFGVAKFNIARAFWFNVFVSLFKGSNSSSSKK